MSTRADTNPFDSEGVLISWLLTLSVRLSRSCCCHRFISIINIDSDSVKSFNYYSLMKRNTWLISFSGIVSQEKHIYINREIYSESIISFNYITIKCFHLKSPRFSIWFISKQYLSIMPIQSSQRSKTKLTE